MHIFNYLIYVLVMFHKFFEGRFWISEAQTIVYKWYLERQLHLIILLQ